MSQNTDSVNVGAAARGARRGLKLGKSTVKGTAKVVKNGAKAAKLGVLLAIKIGSLITTLVGVLGGGVIIAGGVIVVIIAIISGLASQSNTHDRNIDPDLEVLTAVFDEFFASDDPAYKVYQVDLNNNGTVDRVYNQNGDSDLIPITQRNEFSQLDINLLYAAFFVYANNVLVPDSDTGMSGSDDTYWYLIKTEWETIQDNSYEGDPFSSGYIFNAVEDVMCGFFYVENYDTNRPMDAIPDNIVAARELALLTTDNYLDIKEPYVTEEGVDINEELDKLPDKYERSFNRIISNIWYYLDGVSTTLTSRDMFESAVVSKWRYLTYGVSTGGSSIAEIARNEPIQVSGSGSKYWNNCQAWINAVGGPTADEWCAIFVAWCIEQAGYNPADYAWSAGCFTWKNQASSIGIFKYANPEVGDAVIFDYGHTGIVIEVHDDYILTAEGNTGTYDKYTSYVDHRERYFSAGDISGYVTLPKEAGNIAGVEDEVSSVRKTPPQYGNPNYMPSNMGGYSPFSGSINMFPQIHGRGANKGNCTAYAWGRVCEVYGQSIAGRMPTNNAGNWWSSWGGSKGQTPKAGAVAVWSDSSAGHVAFVEQVNADGSILISESAYNSYFFKTDTVTKSNNYGYSGTFLGFIYPNG